MFWCFLLAADYAGIIINLMLKIYIILKFNVSHSPSYFLPVYNSKITLWSVNKNQQTTFKKISLYLQQLSVVKIPHQIWRNSQQIFSVKLINIALLYYIIIRISNVPQFHYQWAHVAYINENFSKRHRW